MMKLWTHVATWLLAAVLVVAGIGKLADPAPVGLPFPVPGWIESGLPWGAAWLELAVAMALVQPSLRRQGAAAACALTLVFAAIVLAGAGREAASRCACMGPWTPSWGLGGHLVLIAAMLVGSIMVFRRAGVSTRVPS